MKDETVGRVVATASVASLVVTTAVAFRTRDEVTQALLHPLTLRESQALVTGLWSANLLVLQVVFLARLPWLERAWGRELLTRRHRQAGEWSFWLVLLHVLLFVVQRYARQRDDPGAAMTALFVTDPWLLPATIGTALLVLVVVTSLTRLRRRLRYETWHLLHLWAYAGMGLALPHQLVSGDLRGGWTAVWWWGLYLVALACVLVFRVGLPLVRSARAGLRVRDVVAAGGGAVTVRMTGRDVAALGAAPGQFLVWRFLGGAGTRRGASRGHPYSLSGGPTGDRLEITVDGDGDGARRLRGLSPGGRVLVEGPYGAFTFRRRRHPHVVFVAAGVGITPVLSLLEGAPLSRGEATVVHRVSDATDAALTDRLEDVCAATGSTLVTLDGHRRDPTSWVPEGTVGEGSEVLVDLLPQLADSDVFVCGPAAWASAVVADLRRAGVARRDIHREDFSW